MESKTIVKSSLDEALKDLSGFLQTVDYASIEYFNTILDGNPVHTFKITYEEKRS